MGKTRGVLTLTFLLLSLVGGVFLVLTNQDLRNRAASSITPSEQLAGQVTVTVAPTIVPTVVEEASGSGELNFRMAMDGIKREAKCAENITVDVKITGEDEIVKEYKKVDLTKEQGIDQLAIYRGKIDLSELPSKKNVTIYITGPKHITTKIGENLDLSYSNKLQDFSGIPLLAGDVNRDGIITKVDFSLVDKLAKQRKSIKDGENLAEDLNGDCNVNSMDVALLLKNMTK